MAAKEAVDTEGGITTVEEVEVEADMVVTETKEKETAEMSHYQNVVALA